jgi:hypothetical protein
VSVKKNKYLKAFLSGLFNPFGEATYQNQITYKHGEITKRINEKRFARRQETDAMIADTIKQIKKMKKK